MESEQGRVSPHVPFLPPINWSTDEERRDVKQKLQSIVDKCVNGQISPDVARSALDRFLTQYSEYSMSLAASKKHSDLGQTSSTISNIGHLWRRNQAHRVSPTNQGEFRSRICSMDPRGTTDDHQTMLTNLAEQPGSLSNSRLQRQHPGGNAGANDGPNGFRLPPANPWGFHYGAPIPSGPHQPPLYHPGFQHGQYWAPQNYQPQFFGGPPPGPVNPTGQIQFQPNHVGSVGAQQANTPRQTGGGATGDRRGRGRDEDEEDEDDEEDMGERPSKRSKQDTSKFGWAADAFIHQATLSQRHIDVADAVQNHAADLDAAIESIESSTTNPMFPRKWWKAVLKDEYVELTEVLALVSAYHNPDTGRSVSNEFAEALQLTTLAKPPASKSITGRVEWQQAWRATAQAIQFVFPDRKRELERYEDHIQNLFDDSRESSYGNILRYDRAVRQLMGTRRDLLYNDYNDEKCVRFRTTYLQSMGRQFQSPSSAATTGHRDRNKSKEVCKKFNLGRNAQEGRIDQVEPSASLSSTLWGMPSLGGELDDVVGDEGSVEQNLGNAERGSSESYLPRFMRGFGFKEDAKPVYSRTAYFTEINNPLPRPPEDEYRGFSDRRRPPRVSPDYSPKSSRNLAPTLTSW
ncbi:hypothetical protein D9757_012025 [Collybiopsis confluens]|uniref:Uncharacterized protein n=1 Tax=Collybiopsis confluens TaxID=2823264 RepID=A0A8H5GDL5_9AGAR|nr:hypothetical protein D9757_012025 [Collybiopsis confluens]